MLPPHASQTHKADLEDIISRYNSVNTVQIKHKTIEKNRLITQEIFNNIEHAINFVERMSYNKQITSEFKIIRC